MFESSKFDKMIKSGDDVSIIKVFLGVNADKERIKDCEKKFASVLGNFKTEKLENGEVAVSTAGREKQIEMAMGELSDYFFEIKTGDTIKFSVNDTEYEI